MSYMMDFFAASTEEKVLAAIKAGTVQYPAYVFIRSTDGKTGRLGFVDQQNVFKYIVGEECKQQVISVTEFPEIGEENVLYIKDGVVYAWTGSEFKAQYKDHTEDLETLNDRLDVIGTKVDGLEKTDETLAGQIEELNAKIDALEIPQECKCTPDNKYDITDVPTGTIVDYREDEIRIMCPQGTEFVKQAVGSGGDPNCNYFTFRTYVPSDDVVGYREHLGDQIDAETLRDFSIDEYGRRYQPTWLALARCDADGDWTYYGAKSTKEHYIGWDYQIDWYNADDIMIASDCVRINLSNEECHFTIEPFYANVDTLKAQIKALEEQVETLEGSSMTFVELD